MGIFKKKTDGINIINLKKTWEKLMLAARAIAAIENPADVFVVASRPYAESCSQVCKVHWSQSHCWKVHSRCLHKSDPGRLQGAQASCNQRPQGRPSARHRGQLRQHPHCSFLQCGLSYKVH